MLKFHWYPSSLYSPHTSKHFFDCSGPLSLHRSYRISHFIKMWAKLADQNECRHLEFCHIAKCLEHLLYNTYFQSAIFRNTLLTLVTKNVLFSQSLCLPSIINYAYIFLRFVFGVLYILCMAHLFPPLTINTSKAGSYWPSTVIFVIYFTHLFIPQTFTEHQQWPHTMGIKHCTRHWTLPQKS